MPGSPRALPAPGTAAVAAGRGHPAAPSPCRAAPGHRPPTQKATFEGLQPPEPMSHSPGLVPATITVPALSPRAVFATTNHFGNLLVCVAGSHHVKAFLFHLLFNLDPLFISLLVLFSPPPFLPKLLLSKS